MALGLSDLRKKFRPLKIFLGFGPGIALDNQMRLHRRLIAAIVGRPVCHHGRGFESGCWSLTVKPVKEETGLAPWV